MSDSDGPGESPNDSDQAYKIDFTYDSNYDHVPANGVMGGVQPRGDCKFEFYLEHFPAPRSQEGTMDADGQRHVHSEEYPSDVVRKLQFAIQCSPNESVRMGLHMIAQAVDVDPAVLWETLSEDILEEQQDQP